MISRFTKILSDVPEDKTFRTSFGEIKNLGELRNALLEKGKQFYEAYVNKNENHFANWVEGVYEDKELSERLKNSNSYSETVKILDNTIKYSDLWLSMNSGKEILNSYISGMSSEIIKNAPSFEPEYHKYEKSFSHEMPSVISSPPRATILPDISPYADEAMETLSEEDAPLTNAAAEQAAEKIESAPEFPKIKTSDVSPPRQRNFFEKLFLGFVN